MWKNEFPFTKQTGPGCREKTRLTLLKKFLLNYNVKPYNDFFM